MLQEYFLCNTSNTQNSSAAYSTFSRQALTAILWERNHWGLSLAADSQKIEVLSRTLKMLSSHSSSKNKLYMVKKHGRYEIKQRSKDGKFKPLNWPRNHKKDTEHEPDGSVYPAYSSDGESKYYTPTGPDRNLSPTRAYGTESEAEAGVHVSDLFSRLSPRSTERERQVRELAAEIEIAESELAARGLAERGLAESGLGESGPAESGLAERGVAEGRFAGRGLAERGLTERALAETETQRAKAKLFESQRAQQQLADKERRRRDAHNPDLLRPNSLHLGPHRPGSLHPGPFHPSSQLIDSTTLEALQPRPRRGA